MAIGFKNVEHLLYLKVNEKIVLIVSDNWKGCPIIAESVDFLMISKKVKEKYREFILTKVLKDSRIIYL